MRKHRVNFNVDKDNSIRFQNWCAIQGFTATDKLAEFVTQAGSNDIPEDYKAQIEDRVYKKLNELI